MRMPAWFKLRPGCREDFICLSGGIRGWTLKSDKLPKIADMHSFLFGLSCSIWLWFQHKGSSAKHALPSLTPTPKYPLQCSFTFLLWLRKTTEKMLFTLSPTPSHCLFVSVGEMGVMAGCLADVWLWAFLYVLFSGFELKTWGMKAASWECCTFQSVTWSSGDKRCADKFSALGHTWAMHKQLRLQTAKTPLTSWWGVLGSIWYHC